MRRPKSDERGQSLVEFALVLPVLLLLLLGILEFGWLFNGQITLTSAAREGARTAVVREDEMAVRVAIKRHVEGLSGFEFGGLYGSRAEMEAAGPLQPREVRAAKETECDAVHIYVHGNVPPLVGLISPRELTAHAVMRKE